MKVNDFKNFLLTFIGIQYKWAGHTPTSGYDCSGLVQELLAALGADPPGDQTAQGLYNWFSIRGSRDVKKTGALCFFGLSDKAITHVAMIFDGNIMLEAGSGNSKTINVYIAEQQDAFIRLRPITRRKDLVAVIFPSDVEDNLI